MAPVRGCVSTPDRHFPSLLARQGSVVAPAAAIVCPLAQALAKVFEIDVTQCSWCGQQGMPQIAVIKDARVLRAMLASIEREHGREPAIAQP